jgi:hypothetical protein
MKAMEEPMSTELVRREPQVVEAENGTGEDVATPDDAVSKYQQFDRYQGIAAAPFSEKESTVLLSQIDSSDVEIRPDGMVYLPEIKYRRRLNLAFGPGAWALMPTERPTVRDNVIMRPFALYVHGRFVSESIGEQEYFENNPTMTWATAAEGAKSNAVMRCCKDLGIASELWDPGFIDKWKKEYAVQVWVEGKNKPMWRRKDRDPLYKESGPVKANKPQAEKAVSKPKDSINFPPTYDEIPPQYDDGYQNIDWDKLEQEHKKPPIDVTTSSSGKVHVEDKPKAASKQEQLPGCITVPQQKRLWAIAMQNKWSKDTLKAWLTQAGIKGINSIAFGEYNDIIDRIQKGPAGA